MDNEDRLDRLLSEYFKKFDDFFPLYGMSKDEAIKILEQCIKSGNSYIDGVSEDVRT